MTPHNWDYLTGIYWSVYLRGDILEREALAESMLICRVQTKMFFYLLLSEVCRLLAECSFYFRCYRQSERLFSLSFRMRERVMPMGDINICIRLKEISNICRTEGRHAQALELNWRADELLQPTRIRLEHNYQS